RSAHKGLLEVGVPGRVNKRGVHPDARPAHCVWGTHGIVRIWHRAGARTHTHTHTHTHAHTHTLIHTHTHTHARTHARIHTHARTHSCGVSCESIFPRLLAHLCGLGSFKGITRG